MGTVGKGVLKVGGRTIAYEAILLTGTKAAAKEWSSTAGKYIIPGAGAVAGISLGAHRIYKGETFKGIIEIISGLISFIPGYGLVASVVVDAGLGIHDLVAGGFVAPSITIDDLPTLYEALGLDRDSDPSKEVIDRIVRERSRPLHQDKVQNEGDDKCEALNDAMQVLNLIKETIYEKRGWN